MLKVTFSQKSIPTIKQALISETDEITILRPGAQGIKTIGVGPCIVFIAYYNKIPLGLYHWSGPLADTQYSHKHSVELAIERLKFKISQQAKHLRVPIFSRDEALNEPFDILPLGGQGCSQSLINALTQIQQEKYFRIMTTRYLNISIEDDYVNITLNANGNIHVQHCGTKKNFEQIKSQLQKEDEILSAAKILMLLSDAEHKKSLVFNEPFQKKNIKNTTHSTFPVRHIKTAQLIG
tara:strand:+ start:70828 stop:71538 length:711 start_codon:yes stop_codon:yes gene_type:complete